MIPVLGHELGGLLDPFRLSQHVALLDLLVLVPGGLERPVVAILRPERAWGGPLELPDRVREAASEASAVMLFGARVLLEGLSADWVLQAPGADARTLMAAVGKSIRA